MILLAEYLHTLLNAMCPEGLEVEDLGLEPSIALTPVAPAAPEDGEPPLPPPPHNATGVYLFAGSRVAQPVAVWLHCSALGDTYAQRRRGMAD